MEAFIALLQVLAIDLVLAGDNAIVIGLAAAGLPKEQRGKAILIGIAAATVLRIIFALLATQLLQILGLLLVGGILLLWVCWKMWRELRTSAKEEEEGLETLTGEDMDKNGAVGNGAAREHPNILIIGLAVSVALMGIAASFIAKLLHRFPWVSYLGLAIILFVALKMIYEGFMEVEPLLASALM
jgi:YjbE family integral membrane protein